MPYYLEAKHRTGNFADDNYWNFFIDGQNVDDNSSFSGTGTAFNLPADPRMILGQTNTLADVFEAFFYDGALNYSFDRDVYLKRSVD